MKYIPSLPTIEKSDKIKEIQDSLRKDISYAALHILSLGKDTINREDIFNTFYDITGMSLSDIQQGECQRKAGKERIITMLRLQDPVTGQPRCYEGSQARVLLEMIRMYAPQAQIEEMPTVG